MKRTYPNDSDRARLAENLAAVRRRVVDAAVAAGRAPTSVRLVCVTKYANSKFLRALVDVHLAEAGAVDGAGAPPIDFGEARPQELWEKADALKPAAIRWHLIGHLQRNKIRRTLPFVSLLHSVDSLRLLDELHEECEKQDRTVDALIEANISGDATKHGFAPDDVQAALTAAAIKTRVRIVGLMGMSGLNSDAEQTRREFAAVRELRDRLATTAPPEVSLKELSMGMSGDLEAAIAEGATLVRVGSALWEGVGGE